MSSDGEIKAWLTAVPKGVDVAAVPLGKADAMDEVERLRCKVEHLTDAVNELMADMLAIRVTIGAKQCESTVKAVTRLTSERDAAVARLAVGTENDQ